MSTPRSRLLTFLALAMLAGMAPARAQEFSTSIMRPTLVDPATGLVAGKLPGGSGSISYYVALDLVPGSLLTQLQVTGKPDGARRLTVELLDANARVADSAFVRAGFGVRDDATKSFTIDTTGRYVLRVTVMGEETGTFCLLMGGSALPGANSPGCPAAAAAAPGPTAPAAPKAIEVVVSKCEERLRVGADLLFDFDRAEVRPEAAPAIRELTDRVAAAAKTVMIEGHTDGKGTESYNQGLSERRAAAVRGALVDRGLKQSQLLIRGFGKSRPVAPNARPDGADDPDGRQKNRRVEVVINTCG
jgi:outer membrane protein OmpA-like peptidoglycan-associated protein